MEYIIGLIASAVPLVFTNNVLMSIVKYLAGQAATKTWLQAVLVFLSALGIIAQAAHNGTPLDFNQVTDLLILGFSTLAIAVASHFSYKAIKHAPSPRNGL